MRGDDVGGVDAAMGVDGDEVDLEAEAFEVARGFDDGVVLHGGCSSSGITALYIALVASVAIMSKARTPTLPDVPVMGEAIAGFEATTWNGVGAPKGTPAGIVDTLNREINAGLADPKLKARIVEFGGTPMAQTPAEFGKFVADETEKWAKVIRAANIKVE